MKIKIFVLLALIIVAPAYAGEPKSFDAAMKELAGDLAKLHTEIQSAYQTEVVAMGFPAVIDLYRPKFVSVTADKGTVYIGADAKAPIVQTVQKGQKFKVVDKVSDWYAVAFDQPVHGMETGWVKAAQVVPQTYFPISTAPPDKSLTDRVYEKIVASVKAFRDRYETNPYVTVKGFSVDISVPPSVSISFEFK
jgi:hypothetical protein